MRSGDIGDEAARSADDADLPLDLAAVRADDDLIEALSAGLVPPPSGPRDPSDVEGELVALLAGWVATEVGRQPWVVYGVMRTSEAVTGANGVPVGYATLVVVYLALAVAVAWILRRLAGAPLGPTAEALPDRGPHVAG